MPNLGILIMRLPWLVLLLVAGAAPVAFAKPPPEPLELALILGNNVHRTDPRRTLQYADDDALRFAQYFRVFYPSGRSVVLTTADSDTAPVVSDLAISVASPTRAGFEAAVKELAAAARAGRAAGKSPIHLFFYFSGHGEEGAVLHLEDDYMAAKERWAALARIGADQVFALLDGCYLGDEAKGPGAPPPPPLFLEEKELPVPGRPPWAGYIGATTPVPEVGILRGGLLTQVALNGLLGLADADRDERVSFYEWGQYIRATMSQRPNAPRVQVVRPRQDPAATVVDLRRMGPGGIIIERDFPTGLVQVTRAGSRDLIAQVHHRRGRPDQLRLPPGRYDVTRFLELNEAPEGRQTGEMRQARVYPAGILTVDLATSKRALLNRDTRMRPVFLVPRAIRGMPRLESRDEVVLVSEEDERVQIQLPLEAKVDLAALRPPPAWSLELRIDNPFLAPLYKAAGEADAGPDLVPGAALRLERLWTPVSRGRWFLSAGPVVQYGVSLQREVYGCRDLEDTECTWPSAQRHQLRLGGAVTERWQGPSIRLRLEQSVAWAPSVLASGAHLVRDVPHDREGEMLEWRYVSPGSVAVDLTAGLLWPIRSHWEIGPQLRLDVELFSRLGRWAVPQVALGLEVRQALLR